MPGWLRGYRAAWLRPDLVAGVIVWSVVVPQCVAYAQIAGLEPQVGLIAAPGAMLAYAFLGSSRTLVVSATTATAALSASAVGPLADGDAARYAALSAALAVVAAAVLAAAGLLRLGSLADFVSKPVMTGFLFGLGLTIMIGQASAALGLPPADGRFFGRLADVIGDLGSTHGATAAVGLGSIAALVALRRLAPAVPGTLVVLAAAVVLSWALDLGEHGVDLVGDLPSGLPDPAVPDVGWADLADLLPAAIGVMIVSAEAVGVARALASKDGYAIDPSRELFALGGSNLLAGLSSGFVQSGGASQTAAAERAGGRTPATSLVAAGLILLTGAFLAPLFEDLPQATLAAIVIVAVAGFVRVDELRRFARIRTSAPLLSVIALVGVLVLGVLPGLLVAAALSFGVVIQKLSRPPVGELARDPASGAWGRADRHAGWEAVPGVLAIRVSGPLFYANALAVKDRANALVAAAEPPPRIVVLDLGDSDELDVQGADTLAELNGELGAKGIELRLAIVRAPAAAVLRRTGLAGRVRTDPTIDAAISNGTLVP